MAGGSASEPGTTGIPARPVLRVRVRLYPEEAEALARFRLPEETEAAAVRRAVRQAAAFEEIFAALGRRIEARLERLESAGLQPLHTGEGGGPSGAMERQAAALAAWCGMED